MTQAVRAGRVLKFCGLIALGLAVAVLQGLAVFAFEGFGGSFLSVTGAECVAIPLGVELVLLVVTVQKFDELHAVKASNPHSLIGQALRDDAARPPAPPPTRDAWKGGFAAMDEASDKMAKGR